MTRRLTTPEAAIQQAVIEHLRWRAKPDVLWLHPANGGTRDIREAARFKRMGVLAGASDLLFWHRGNSFALELKSPGGRLSDAQLEFLARFNDAGGHSASTEGIDRALAVLEAWGLLRGHVS
jgi:VRR-NUC domain